MLPSIPHLHPYNPSQAEMKLRATRKGVKEREEAPLHSLHSLHPLQHPHPYPLPQAEMKLRATRKKVKEKEEADRLWWRYHR